MRSTRRLFVAVAATATLALAGASVAVAQGAFAHASGDPSTASQGAPSPDESMRGEAEMPERIIPANYEYANALMQLPTDQLEPTFMGEIIPHHAAVVEMSRIAMEKASHPPLKTLAGAIIASQTQQIEEFTQILQSEYGLTPEQARQQAPGQIPQILERVNRGLDEKVASVRDAPAGDQFDQIWLKEVIPHHQVAILEFQAVQDGARNPRLVLMANMGILGQQGQIAQMLNWLEQWYGDGSTDGGAAGDQVEDKPEGGVDTGDGSRSGG
jgi:uncharacterized protein (DUF305 family)